MQPDRTRQRNLAVIDDDHLALDAAQRRAGAAGVDAAAMEPVPLKSCGARFQLNSINTQAAARRACSAGSARRGSTGGWRRDRAFRGSGHAGRARARPGARPRRRIGGRRSGGRSDRSRRSSADAPPPASGERGLRDFVAPSSSERNPSRAISGSPVSLSQCGASMPPAQWLVACVIEASPRSCSVTLQPALANISACQVPTMPAPMTLIGVAVEPWQFRSSAARPVRFKGSPRLRFLSSPGELPSEQD